MPRGGLILLVALSMVPLGCLEECTDPIPAPAAPIPLSPDDGTVLGVGETITLTWVDGDPFEQYVLQVAVGEDFSTPVVEKTIAHDLAQLHPLARGEYAWRVQRVAIEGIAGAWSTVQHFSVVDGFWRLFDRSAGSAGDSDYGTAIAPAVDGGAVILGRSGGRTLVIVTDPQGRVDWEHRMPTSDYVGKACLPNADGSIAIIGYTKNGTVGSDDLLYLEVLPSGDFIAFDTYGGEGEDWAYDICRASDGGFAVIGATNSHGSGHYDVWLIRFDAQGHKLWERTYGGTFPDGGFAITATEDNGFVFVGIQILEEASLGILWCVRVDSEGEEEWGYSATHHSRSSGGGILATSDGAFVVVGDTDLAPGNTDLVLMKIDAMGQLCWERTFGGSADDYGRAVAVCPDGGFVVAGEHGDEGLWLLKTDDAGIEQWRRYYGSDEVDTCVDLAPAEAGGFWLLGSNRSLTGGASDIWLIKTDEFGRAPAVR